MNFFKLRVKCVAQLSQQLTNFELATKQCPVLSAIPGAGNKK